MGLSRTRIGHRQTAQLRLESELSGWSLSQFIGLYRGSSEAWRRRHTGGEKGPAQTFAILPEDPIVYIKPQEVCIAVIV